MDRENAEGLLGGSQKHEEETGNGNGEAPVTLVLVLSVFVVLCGNFTFGCSMGYSSPAQFAIMNDLGLSTAEYSVFASIITVGGMVGAVISGKITDLIGRRANAWWLDLGRLSTGFGVGIYSFAGPAYNAEITPKNLRGTFSTTSQLMTSCGISLMYFIGTIINWRTLAIVGSIPCFIPLISLYFLPESPRWLARTGREKELEASLRRLRGESRDTCLEAAEIRDYAEAFNQLSESRFLNLFQPRYKRALTAGVGLILLQQFGGSSAVVAYASDIFVSAGFSSTLGSIALAIIQIPATLVSVILVDKSGRRPILMVCAAGMCLSSFLVGISFFLQDFNRWMMVTPISVFVGIMAYIMFYSGGMESIPLLLMAEIFPTNVKGSAGSLIILVSSFSAWITVYSFTFMMEWSSTGTFFISAIICGLAVLFVAKLVPETKGRTLEEIQASLTHFPL